MATRKIQVPAVGGVRKVIQPAAGSNATTIAGLEGQTLSVGQLKTLLGNTGTTVAAGGSGAAPPAASLIVGPGLTGGGALLGAVPLGLRFPTPPVMWVDSLLPDDFIAPVGGTGGTASPLTTKGDVYVFGTGNTRLPVGSDGQIVAADSTQALGVKWATPTTGLVYSNTTVPGGNTVANTVTETTFSSSYSIPANALAAGSVVTLRAFGVASTDTIAPTIRLKLKAGSVVLLDTTAISPLIASSTNDGWALDAQLICQTVGATGTVEAQGFARFQTATGTSAVISLDNTSAVTVDTTAIEALTLTVTWGTASAANTITLRELSIWLENPGVPFTGGGGSGVIFTDGTHTVTGATQLTFSGATVSGASPNAIVTISGSTAAIDTPPATPTVWDDEFNTGTVLDTTGSRFAGANPWSYLSSSSWPVPTVGSGWLRIAGTSGAPANFAAKQPVPASGAWCFVLKAIGVLNNQAYYGPGLAIINNAGSSNNLVQLMVYQNALYEQTNSYNPSTGAFTFSSNGTTVGMPSNAWYYLAIYYPGSGTTYTLGYSTLATQLADVVVPPEYVPAVTGMPAGFTQHSTISLAGVTHIALTDIDSALAASYCDWFRRTL